METNGNPFLRIQTELTPFLVAMGKAADMILDAEISAYPVFIASKRELPVGVLLIHQEEDWTINVSTLEELVTRQIVVQEKVADFRAVFKDPRQFICVFVVQETGSNFLFIPRQLVG
jgi:hypothetical protein